jgi:hypothetical protein
MPDTTVTVTAGMPTTVTVTGGVIDVTIDVQRGIQGIQGIQGEGVPAGGSTHQVLRKINATDFNTEFATLGVADIGGAAPIASPTFTGTVGGITKSMVGLGNVDNTADTAKPVSTAQQTALDLKANILAPTLTDSSSIPSIDTDNRYLIDSGNTPSIDWHNRTLDDTNDVTRLDWNSSTVNVYGGLDATQGFTSNGSAAHFPFGLHVESDDTTLSRSAAGKLAVEGVDVVLTAGTQTVAGAKTLSGQLELTGQSATTANSAMTRGLSDDAEIDFDKLVLRDDFISLTSAATTNISELSWNRYTNNGAGTLRQATVQSVFGTCSLISQAAFRAGQMLAFAGNTLTGSSGFLFSLIDNSTTVIKARIQLTSLNTRFDFGIASNLLNGGTYIAPYRQSRKFGVNYTKLPTAWTAINTVALNEFRVPTVSNGRRYYASVAGTTGATEPVFPMTDAGTVVDGTVTWVESGREGGNTFVIMQHTTAGETNGVIVDTGITVVVNTFYEIKIEYVTSSQWRFTINGVATLINTTSFGSSTYNPQYVIENTDNIANTLNIDYFGLKSRVTR